MTTRQKIKLIKKHQYGGQVPTTSQGLEVPGLKKISDIPIPTYQEYYSPYYSPQPVQQTQSIIYQSTQPATQYSQKPTQQPVQSQPFTGNVPPAIQQLVSKAHEGKFYSPDKKRYLELGNNKYKHLCTSGPASFYKDALGIKLNGLWWDTGSPKTAHKTNITKAGFTEKWAGDGADVRNGNWKSAVRPGDIMVLFSSNSAHAEMWDGTKWISDTNQNKAWCYGKDNGRFGKRSAILYRNDKLWA